VILVGVRAVKIEEKHIVELLIMPHLKSLKVNNMIGVLIYGA
jgi:hypothetical protein